MCSNARPYDLAKWNYLFNSGSYMYLEINSKGKLCLSSETIVDINPPKVQIADGEIINSGCNIDHKHVFESEVVCDINNWKGKSYD